MSIAKPYHIFISRVSGEMKQLSEVLASDLRAKGITGKIQIDFRQEDETESTLDLLEKYVREADAVIALIGVQSGSYPPDHAAQKWNDLLPAGITRATYTQWEVHFARAYKKRLSFYYAFDEATGAVNYPAERAPNPTTDDPAGQRDYALWLTKTLGINRGYFGTADALCRAVLKEDWPQFPRRQFMNLPYNSLGKFFVGRGEFLAQIAADLQAERAAGRTDPNHVIWGIGGVGKTRAACEYAWAHRADYHALLFVSGESEQRLLESLASLSGVLELGLEAGLPTEVQCQQVLQWLQEHPGWLLIIDNVDDPTAVRAVLQRLTDLSHGHVIITARLGKWTDDVTPLELHLLSEEAAVSYLDLKTKGQRQSAATPEQDAQDAKTLAHTLGYLSLALEQAAAYIYQQHASYAAYTQRFQQTPEALLDFMDAETSTYKKTITGAERTVAKTWLITLDQLPPASLALLRTFAWFAPEPIPEFLLHFDPETLSECDPTAVKARLRPLEDYAFLHWDSTFDNFNIHRLVQEITRQQQTAHQSPPALLTAVTWLKGVFPFDCDDVRFWPIADRLASHAEEATKHAHRLGIPHPTAALSGQLGTYHHAKAQHSRAESHQRLAVDIYENKGGTPHENYATALNNLAGLLQATNRLTEAEPLMRRALAIDEASFGTQHPTVAIRLNNLAGLLQATNRLPEAEEPMRRVVEIFEKSLGKDHPNVAVSLNNLAGLLQATNRLPEAEPLMRRALEIVEASFGPQHPKVAIRLNNLAGLLQATNRLPEAEPLMRRALEIDEASFGPHHPDVAIDLNNLAQLLQDTNRLTEAEPLMRRALEIDEASFGPQHPKLAIRLNNLAALLQATNLLTEAEPLMRRALAIDEASFGPLHPKVAIRLNNLARLLQATNCLPEAEPLMRRHLEIFIAFTQATGHPHPHLQGAINNYGDLLMEMGQTQEQAVAQIQELLAPLGLG